MMARPLGETPASSDTTPAVAAVMTGATAGLIVYVFKGPVWASILVGAFAALVTKATIERSGASA
jgi:hypothetical protein